MKFLLIHGAWHGAWCWEKLIAALEKKGAEVAAITLPGHAKFSVGGWRISTGHYARATNRAARKMGGEVHVVGHSMGGIVITAAAEAEPELYASLTYMTAFLLPNGKSLMEMAAEHPNPQMMSAMQSSQWRGSLVFAAEKRVEAFYEDCDRQDAEAASARLCPQPVRPFLSATHHTPERWGKLPRHYLFCTRDKAISIEAQKAMEAALPCAKTATLDTAHSPFLSRPEETADALLGFVKG